MLEALFFFVSAKKNRKSKYASRDFLKHVMQQLVFYKCFYGSFYNLHEVGLHVHA